MATSCCWCELGVSILTFASGRTNVLQGLVLLLFVTFLLLLVQGEARARSAIEEFVRRRPSTEDGFAVSSSYLPPTYFIIADNFFRMAAPRLPTVDFFETGATFLGSA